jgi:hypothetical protein
MTEEQKYRQAHIAVLLTKGFPFMTEEQKYRQAHTAVLPTAVGGFRESNSGPLAPEASIIPLNQIP